MTTALPTDGSIAAYVTNADGKRCGWVFRRGYEYHTVLWDDRYSDAEVNRPHHTLDDAIFEGLAKQYLYDRLDEASRLEAADRMQDTVDMWDEQLVS